MYVFVVTRLIVVNSLPYLDIQILREKSRFDGTKLSESFFHLFTLLPVKKTSNIVITHNIDKTDTQKKNIHPAVDRIRNQRNKGCCL